MKNPEDTNSSSKKPHFKRIFVVVQALVAIIYSVVTNWMAYTSYNHLNDNARQLRYNFKTWASDIVTDVVLSSNETCPPGYTNLFNASMINSHFISESDSRRVNFTNWLPGQAICVEIMVNFNYFDFIKNLAHFKESEDQLRCSYLRMETQANSEVELLKEVFYYLPANHCPVSGLIISNEIPRGYEKTNYDGHRLLGIKRWNGLGDQPIGMITFGINDLFTINEDDYVRKKLERMRDRINLIDVKLGKNIVHFNKPKKTLLSKKYVAPTEEEKEQWLRSSVSVNSQANFDFFSDRIFWVGYMNNDAFVERCEDFVHNMKDYLNIKQFKKSHRLFLIICAVTSLLTGILLPFYSLWNELFIHRTPDEMQKFDTIYTWIDRVSKIIMIPFCVHGTYLAYIKKDWYLNLYNQNCSNERINNSFLGVYKVLQETFISDLITIVFIVVLELANNYFARRKKKELLDIKKTYFAKVLILKENTLKNDRLSVDLPPEKLNLSSESFAIPEPGARPDMDGNEGDSKERAQTENKEETQSELIKLLRSIKQGNIEKMKEN